jgi:outer membrane lipoprotein-sorting protein
MNSSFLPRWAIAGLGFLIVTTAGMSGDRGPKAEGPEDPALRAMLERFDGVQEQIRTLRADFTMITRNPMLKEPVESRGRIYLTKPDSVRWEFSEPEEMAFVIANDEYIGYFPKRKRAERREFHRWSEQVFQYFGLGQGSLELAQMYDIRLDEEDGPDNTCVLELEPRKRRARKRVESVLLWVDRATLLPTRVRYDSRQGSSREIRFRDMQVNPDLSAALYRMELPPDVTVVRGAVGLGSALAPGASSN